MRPTLLAPTLAMLASCAPDTTPALQPLAVDQAPAPYVTLLQPDFIAATLPHDLRVYGTLGDGEAIYIGRSFHGAGSGPCPRAAGGLCLDIQAPATLAAVIYADENGEASITMTLPPGRIGSEVAYQAVVIRGLHGSASIKSEVVSDTVIAAIYGCTFPAADNYDPTATFEDGSCTYTPPSGGDLRRFTWSEAGVANNGRANAEVFCAGLGGTLARPESQGEWDVVYDLIPQDSRGWWIDGHNDFTCGSATPGSPKPYEYGNMYAPSGTPNMYTGCDCDPTETGLVAYRYDGSSPFDGCQGVDTSVGNLGVMDEQTTYDHPDIAGFICEFPAALVSVEMDVGRVPVPNHCVSGDYECQAKATCEFVSGVPCVFQDFSCYALDQTSYYPSDTPGVFGFNFSTEATTRDGYGNICGCDAPLFESYGLRAFLTYCGMGQWNRD